MYKDLFPFFKNSDITYLDNGATTQKPQNVINSIQEFYTTYNSNTHRSSYGSANKATTKFEETRSYIKEFINANNSDEIIFTSGITQSINFIAEAFVKDRFDTVIISSLEHHSNIVPWHMQGRTLHNGLEVVTCNENLEFDYAHFEELLSKHPNSFVSITHVSNAFGTIHNIKKIGQLAHKYNTPIMVDGAQSIVHFEVDVQSLDVDFYAISAHKTFGPTGVGAVYIKEAYLKEVNPYITGGATIHDVSFEKSIMLDSPYKYEAGTQNIAGVIAFKEALLFIDSIGYEKIQSHEEELYEYLYKELLKIEDIILYNDTSNAIGSRSFNIKGINHSDVGILLDKQKVAIRVGHHCAQPIMKALNISGTIRASIAIYNDKEDIDKFIGALNRALNMLRG